ncbi:P3R3URF protein isoform X1 [Phascolarctos cinereus]
MGPLRPARAPRPRGLGSRYPSQGLGRRRFRLRRLRLRTTPQRMFKPSRPRYRTQCGNAANLLTSSSGLWLLPHQPLEILQEIEVQRREGTGTRSYSNL